MVILATNSTSGTSKLCLSIDLEYDWDVTDLPIISECTKEPNSGFCPISKIRSR